MALVKAFGAEAEYRPHDVVSAGSPSLQSAVTFFSRYAWRFNTSAASATIRPALNYSGYNATNNPGTTHWYVTFHMRWDSLPASSKQFMYWASAGAHSPTRWYMDNLGIIRMYEGDTPTIKTAGTAIEVGKWYVVSFDFQDENKTTFRVYDSALNNVVSLVSTENHTSTGAGTYFEVGNINTMTADWYLDNWVCGTSGDPYATLGYTYAVRALFPTGAGIYQDQSSGTYADVDENPDDGSTTEVNLNTSGAAIFTMEPAAGGEISFAAAIGSAVMRATSGTGNFHGGFRIRIGGTNYDGSDLNMPNDSTERTPGVHYPTNPATAAAWTASDLSAIEFGIYATSSRQGRPSQLVFEYVSPIAVGGNRLILAMSSLGDAYDRIFRPRSLPKLLTLPKPQVLTPTARQVKALAA